MAQTHDFSQGEISKNIMSLALPMTAAQLINVLYSVVDRMYLGAAARPSGPHGTGSDDTDYLHYHGFCQSLRDRRRAFVLHPPGQG